MKFGIREIIFVALMIALVVCAYMFVFQPAAAKRQARATDVIAKKRALADLKLATAGISDLERKIRELQEAIQFFEKKLPAQRDLDKILTDLTKRAEEHNLQTKTFRTLKIETAAGYSELPIQMSLTGDFEGFYAFLLDLEKLPRITRVTQMKLEKIASRDGAMQAQLTLSIFFEPIAENVATAN